MWLLNYSNLIDPLLKDLRVFVAEFSEAKAREKILDIGCATGDQVFHYARAGAFAAGIDLNPKMIKIAEERKKKEGIGNVNFRVASAFNLPFEDSFFDKASISLVLHEIESGKRNKIISEMKRVVKKDGHLIFIDFNIPFPRNITSYLIGLAEYLAGKNNYENFRSYLKEGGLGFLLQKNGLKEEKTVNFSGGLLTILKTKNI